MPSKFLFRELRSVVLGEKLGEGVARKVYALRLNPTYVIKIERNGRSFQNITEWETWEWSTGGLAEKWLAPCEIISTCGSMLIQRRVEPIRKSELPKLMPAFLTDLKPSNFGRLDGKVVCCDYGITIANASLKMRKAEWRT